MTTVSRDVIKDRSKFLLGEGYVICGGTFSQMGLEQADGGAAFSSRMHLSARMLPR